MVMHRVGDDVLSEVARELDQLSDTVGCFEEDELWDIIWRLDVLRQHFECAHEVCR